MKIVILFLCFLCLFSCNEDNVCEGDLFEQFLFIEIVDESGNNLISNNTFNSSDIIVSNSSGYETINPVQNILDKKNLIVILVNGKQGSNTFNIQLSNSITDTLIMNINNERTEPPCSVTISTLNSAAYNSVNQILKDFEGYLITIVK